MGAAFYVVLQDRNTEAQPIITSMDGKALSRATERLEDIAERLGVTPLMQFFSEDAAKLAEMLGHNDDDDDDDDDGDDDGDDDDDKQPVAGPARVAPAAVAAAAAPEGTQGKDGEDGEAGEGDGAIHFVEDWFDATEGLKTVRALIDHIEHEPGAVDEPERVLEELGAIAKVLEIAEQAKTGFHVAIDF